MVVRVEALRAACAQSTFCNTWAPPTTDRKLETWGVAWVSFYVPLSLSLLRSLSLSLSVVSSCTWSGATDKTKLTLGVCMNVGISCFFISRHSRIPLHPSCAWSGSQPSRKSFARRSMTRTWSSISKPASALFTFTGSCHTTSREVGFARLFCLECVLLRQEQGASVRVRRLVRSCLFDFQRDDLNLGS